MLFAKENFCGPQASVSHHRCNSPYGENKDRPIDTRYLVQAANAIKETATAIQWSFMVVLNIAGSPGRSIPKWRFWGDKISRP